MVRFKCHDVAASLSAIMSQFHYGSIQMWIIIDPYVIAMGLNSLWFDSNKGNRWLYLVVESCLNPTMVRFKSDSELQET